MKKVIREGAMSDIDIMAGESKSFKDFVKEFYKEFKDFPKNREAMKWLEDTYKSVNESTDSDDLERVADGLPQTVEESVNESPDTNSLKKIHDAVLKFLKTKKGVGEVKEFPEFPNRYGDNVSTFSVKYNIEDKYNYDLQEIKIEYSTSRVFIPNKGYFPFKTFNDIKNIINKKSSLKESVNELDINDPIMMKLRAAQMKRNKDAATKVEKEKKINPDYTALKNATKIKALKKKRAEVMRDMEQEAEPEGGKIADRYGKLLNRIDNDIIKLGGNPMSESVNESSTINKRRAGAELKQKLKGKRSDGMGEYTGTIYGLDSTGKRVELKNLNDLNKYSEFELGESVNEETKRDYKAEYKKFQSSEKSKKYRAELNKYNRDKGTYGNGDGKDASHKGGKIVGFEAESKNRGRAEKSRLKKESAGCGCGCGCGGSKLTESVEPQIITQLKDIVNNKQNKVLVDPKSGKKMRVDLFSASAITQVYDALKQQSNKDKFVGSGLMGMQSMAMKLLK
jgi:hypothetical protein